jgi:L-ascorbate metabolism protein UlaG (beta-lactamase superfamily)
MRAGDAVYLREDVRAEPLVNGFRAWPHLIAPHTYACNAITKHLPSLRAALGEASDRGDGARVDELRRRIGVFADERRQLIELGEAIKELDSLLLSSARGLSMEPLYARVPRPLRGFVELVYDRYNSPGVRFLEGAFYNSAYYDPALHSVRLQRVDPDLPGEGISAPRLPGAGQLILSAPFDGEIWDVLGRARRRSARAGDIADALGAPLADLAPYMTPQPPGRLDVPEQVGPRARFLNHACVLVESPRTTLLVDPLVAYRRHGRTDRVSFADLPDLSCLAITHGHLDHFDIETLLQVRHLTDEVIVPRTGAGDLLDPSLRLALGALGFRKVRELDEFESHPIADGAVLALPFLGEHSDLPVRGKLGYGVELAGRTCVLVADSRCLEPRIYQNARERLGPVGAVFVGMECEGSPMTTANRPYLPTGLHTLDMAQSRRTKASDAAAGLALVRALRPSRAYVYAMGLEAWLSYMFGVPDETRRYSLAQTDLFIDGCAALGIPAKLLCGSQVVDLPADGDPPAGSGATLHGRVAGGVPG